MVVFPPAIRMLTPSHPPPFRGRGTRWLRFSWIGIDSVPATVPQRPLPLKGGGWEGVVFLATIGARGAQ